MTDAKGDAPSADQRTVDILQEMLSREIAAKTLYEDLAERVKGSEFEHLHGELHEMAVEEAEHVEQVRELLEKVRGRLDA